MSKHSWLLIAPLAFIGLGLAVVPLILPREARRQDGMAAAESIAVAAELPVEEEPDYQGATECFPDWEPYYRKYLRSSVAYVARYHSPAGKDSFGQKMSHLEIAEVLHDATGVVSQGSVVPYHVSPKVAAQSPMLFLGGPMGRKTGDIYWNTQDCVSAEFIQFLRNVPDRECPDLARWTYAVGFVGRTDPLILDSIREIIMGVANEPVAPAPGFREFRKILQGDSLRLLLMDPDSPREQQAVAALLLGFCGDDQDEPALRQLVLQLEDRQTWNVDYPVMSGYLMLTKGAGIDLLAKERLKKESTHVSGLLSAVAAIRFAALHSGAEFDRDRALQALRPLLHHEKIADDAIDAIAELKDWTSMDEVVRQFDAISEYQSSVRWSIVGYLFAAEADVPQGTGASTELPTHAVNASRHLKVLGQRDPKLVYNVGRQRQ
jgi:hypothetical protein